jgi:hypothetical protein
MDLRSVQKALYSGSKYRLGYGLHVHVLERIHLDQVSPGATLTLNRPGHPLHNSVLSFYVQVTDALIILSTPTPWKFKFLTDTSKRVSCFGV